MDLFFSAILLGLFALIVSELFGSAVGWLISLLRPDLDPNFLANYIQRVAIPVITTCWALYLETEAGTIVLLAGAAAAVALMARKWLSRDTVVVPASVGRRR